jgi:hypothetical protein
MNRGPKSSSSGRSDISVSDSSLYSIVDSTLSSLELALSQMSFNRSIASRHEVLSGWMLLATR